MLEEPPECFICTDTTPAPRKSACLCVGRYVHDACLARMLTTSRHATCPVCAAPYANVHSSSRAVGFKCDSAGALGCGMVLVSVVLLVCAINTWFVLCCTSRGLSAVDVGVVSMAAVLMTVAVLTTLVMLVRLIVLRGLSGLVQSAIVRQLTVSVRATPCCTLPREVAMAEL